MVCSFLRWIRKIRTGHLPLVQPVKLCVRLLIVAIQGSRRFSSPVMVNRRHLRRRQAIGVRWPRPLGSRVAAGETCGGPARAGPPQR